MVSTRPPTRVPRLLGAVVALAVATGSVVVAPSAGADQAAIDAAQRRADAAAASYAEAQADLAEIEQGLVDLEHQVAGAEAELATLRSAVQELALRSYVRSDGAVAAWMVDGDLNEHVVADALARFVTVGQRDAIDAYTEQREDLDVARSELADRREDQAAAIAELERRQAELEAEIERLQEEERRRQEEERRRQEEEARRRAEEERRAAEASAAAAAAARSAPSRSSSGAGTSSTSTSGGTSSSTSGTTSTSSSGSGSSGGGQVIASGSGWICPVQGPRTYTNDWGAPRPGGRAHMGNDILAPLGTPIVAPVSGRYEPAFDRDGGLTMKLWGDDGNYYWGDHLSGHEGGARRVSAGEVIGYVGNTGDARGGPTHLHLEIHPGGGGAVNPYPWVSRAC